MFAMPAAALEGPVIVDYGLQLGHVGINIRQKRDYEEFSISFNTDCATVC